MWRTHPRDVLTGPRRPCDIAPALGDIATSPRARERSSDIAQAFRDVARDVARGAWPKVSRIVLVVSLLFPPLWVPVPLVRCCDVAQAVCDVARSPRARGRCSDIAQALCDVARDVAGAMLRCRAMWRTHPRDILTAPRRTCDIAPALSDIATSHPRSWQTITCDIAPRRGDIATSPS